MSRALLSWEMTTAERVVWGTESKSLRFGGCVDPHGGLRGVTGCAEAPPPPLPPPWASWSRILDVRRKIYHPDKSQVLVRKAGMAAWPWGNSQRSVCVLKNLALVINPSSRLAHPWAWVCWNLCLPNPLQSQGKPQRAGQKFSQETA